MTVKGQGVGAAGLRRRDLRHPLAVLVGLDRRAGDGVGGPRVDGHGDLLVGGGGPPDGALAARLQDHAVGKQRARLHVRPRLKRQADHGRQCGRPVDTSHRYISSLGNRAGPAGNDVARQKSDGSTRRAAMHAVFLRGFLGRGAGVAVFCWPPPRASFTLNPASPLTRPGRPPQGLRPDLFRRGILSMTLHIEPPRCVRRLAPLAVLLVVVAVRGDAPAVPPTTPRPSTARSSPRSRPTPKPWPTSPTSATRSGRA